MKYIILIIALIFGMNNYSFGETFILESLTDAIAISEDTQQPILLIFGSENCRFCQNLKNDILNKNLDSVVDRYLICYIDIDKKPEIKNEYNIRTIPDIRIIKNKVQISKIIGYSKNSFIEKLKDVK